MLKKQAKAMIAGIPSTEALVNKLSALLVGKKFRGKFQGETSQKGDIYAILNNYESMKIAITDTKLKFDPSWDIKAYNGPVTQVSTTATESVDSVSTSSNDLESLPF